MAADDSMMSPASYVQSSLSVAGGALAADAGQLRAAPKLPPLVGDRRLSCDLPQGHARADRGASQASAEQLGDAEADLCDLERLEP